MGQVWRWGNVQPSSTSPGMTLSCPRLLAWEWGEQKHPRPPGQGHHMCEVPTHPCLAWRSVGEDSVALPCDCRVAVDSSGAAAGARGAWAGHPQSRHLQHRHRPAGGVDSRPTIQLLGPLCRRYSTPVFLPWPSPGWGPHGVGEPRGHQEIQPWE